MTPSISADATRDADEGADATQNWRAVSASTPFGAASMGGSFHGAGGRGQAAEIKMQKLIDSMLFESWRGECTCADRDHRSDINR